MSIFTENKNQYKVCIFSINICVSRVYIKRKLRLSAYWVHEASILQLESNYIVYISNVTHLTSAHNEHKSDF